MAIGQKRLLVRRNELSDSEKLIRSSRRLLEQGEHAHAMALSAQLRGLLCRTRFNSPLLLDLAGLLNMPLECIGTVTTPRSHGIRDDVHRLVRWVSIPTRESPFQTTLFHEWLSTKSLSGVLSFGNPGDDGPTYSPIDLIKLHADKFGGAHFDPTVDDDHDRIRTTTVRDDGRFTMIEELLIQTSEVAEFHARRVIARLDSLAYSMLQQGVDGGMLALGPNPDITVTVRRSTATEY